MADGKSGKPARDGDVSSKCWERRPKSHSGMKGKCGHGFDIELTAPVKEGRP